MTDALLPPYRQNPRSDPYRHLLLDVISSDCYVGDFVSHESLTHGSARAGGCNSLRLFTGWERIVCAGSGGIRAGG